MKYLLDTHAAVWLLEGSPKLGRKAKGALEVEGSDAIAISDVTLLEIAMLEARGTLDFLVEPARALAAFAARLTVLPIDAQIAADAARSALPHRDPFDRVIVATARHHGLVLVTKDRAIRSAKLVPTLW